jgi:hypothetical protein
MAFERKYQPTQALNIHSNLVRKYLANELHHDHFKSQLEQLAIHNVVDNGLKKELHGKQAIIIGNHPTWRSLTVKIDPENAEEFVSPFLKHILVSKLLHEIPYQSLIKGIGFPDKLKHFNCLPLPLVGGIDYTVNFLNSYPTHSLYIHPEGGVENLRKGSFKTGFYIIAKLAKIKNLVLTALSDEIKLGENHAHIIDIIEIPEFDPLTERQKILDWADTMREKIKTYKFVHNF